eukprot:scaffold9676_cov42-Phaeocystis_antarctica.AAC.3
MPCLLRASRRSAAWRVGWRSQGRDCRRARTAAAISASTRIEARQRVNLPPGERHTELTSVLPCHACTLLPGMRYLTRLLHQPPC